MTTLWTFRVCSPWHWGDLNTKPHTLIKQKGMNFLNLCATLSFPYVQVILLSCKQNLVGWCLLQNTDYYKHITKSCKVFPNKSANIRRYRHMTKCGIKTTQTPKQSQTWQLSSFYDWNLHSLAACGYIHLFHPMGRFIMADWQMKACVLVLSCTCDFFGMHHCRVGHIYVCLKLVMFAGEFHIWDEIHSMINW